MHGLESPSIPSTILTTDPLSKNRTALRLALLVARIFIVVGILWFAWHHLNFVALCKSLNVFLLRGAFAFQPFAVGGIFLFALRFAYLAQTPRAPFIPTWKGVVLAYGMNLFLPGRISEAIKPAYLKKHIGLPLSDGFSTVVLERMTDAALLGLFGLVAVPVFAGSISLFKLLGLVIAAGAILAAVPFAEQPLQKVASRIPWEKPRKFILHGLEHFAHRVRTRYFAKAFLCGFGAWCAGLAAVAAFLYVSGLHEGGMAAAFKVYIASVVGIAVPALPGGFGTYEASVAYVLKGLGFPMEQAVSTALVLHFAQLFFVAVGGILIVLTEKIDVAAMVGRARKQTPSSGYAKHSS